MRCSIVALAASLLAASVVSAQGVTSAIAPDSSPPSGCSETFDGTFAITVDSLSSGKLRKRQNGLTISLNNGVLTDQNGRTGYIASNYQFQFDKPPQAGAIYTAGFSVCNNGSLALGDEAVWWECQSGGFYNLYDRDWATQCLPILIEVVGASLGSTPTESTTAAASSEQAGSTNVAVTVPSQNTNTEFIASSGTAVPVTESTGQAVGPSTPALPVTGTSASAGSVTGSGPSATGGAGNSTAPSQPFSNSTTVLASTAATITSSTSIKSSSSTASAKSSSASGAGVPLRAQDALSGLGAALLGFALL